MRVSSKNILSANGPLAVSAVPLRSDLPNRRRENMLAHVVLFLFRAGCFSLLVYGARYDSPVIAVPFGLLLLHSVIYPQFYLKPSLLDAYLLFTVLVGYYHFVMGWGSTTWATYQEEGSLWVKVVKDVVWIAVLALTFLIVLLRPRLRTRHPLLSTIRGRMLGLATLLYLAIPVATMSYHGGFNSQNVLMYLRYPLEYIPIVFLLPYFLSGESSVRYLKSFIPLVVLTLVFLPYEMLSGLPGEISYGGIYTRYGSVFGSPNDFGVFLMLNLTFLLAFAVERALRLSLKTIAYMMACLGALASTISLSAVLATVFSGVGILALAKRKLTSLLVLAALGCAGGGLYWYTSGTGVARYLTERIEGMTTRNDASARLHAELAVEMWKTLKDFSGTEYLLGAADATGRNEFYFELLAYRCGVPETLLLLLIIGLSVYEARRRYVQAASEPVQRGLWLGAQLALCSFSFASLFIPYFDSFPSNFYFWFIVAIVWAEPMQRTAVHAARGAAPRQELQSHHLRLAK